MPDVIRRSKRNSDFYEVVRNGRVVSRHMTYSAALDVASASYRVKMKRMARKRGFI